MTVYVDSLFPTRPTPRWRFNAACHLVSDSLEELHEFAKKLGLKRSWFQNHARLPHYDLTENKRRQAVRLGAIEVDRKKIVSMMQGRRAPRNAERRM